MTIYDNLMQLKAFARQDGLILALVWIASFAATMYLPASGLGNLLALATPFVVGWRLCSFRNYALDGVISFRRGYGFSVYTFFYASMIFAVAQYLYFKFLDHGMFAEMLATTLQAVMDAYKQAGMATEEMQATADMMQQLTPVNWAFMFMVQNFFIGIAMSLPIAAVCMKRTNKRV